MPRHRGTHEGAATLIGKLLLLIAAGKETSTSLAASLGVSPRQVNRYVLQLVAAGWQIERVGAWTKADYWFELKTPSDHVSQGIAGKTAPESKTEPMIWITREEVGQIHGQLVQEDGDVQGSQDGQDSKAQVQEVVGPVSR